RRRPSRRRAGRPLAQQLLGPVLAGRCRPPHPAQPAARPPLGDQRIGLAGDPAGVQHDLFGQAEPDRARPLPPPGTASPFTAATAFGTHVFESTTSPPPPSARPRPRTFTARRGRRVKPAVRRCENV